jgi:hypothetical protein
MDHDRLVPARSLGDRGRHHDRRPAGTAEMSRREVLAWAVALIAITCILVLAVRPQPQGLTASERRTLAELGDAPGQRLYQAVSDVAAVHPRFAGAGATASVDGNDAVGQVNITTGAHPAAGSLVHITFAAPYKTQPFVIVNPMDQAPPPDWFVTVDTNGWDIVVGSAPKPDTNYPFAYFIAPRPWLMYPNGK